VPLTGNAAIATTDGLLAEYDFVPGADAQVLYDVSGQGRNGQLGRSTGADGSDPAWTDEGLSFDGTDDVVTLGDVFDVTASQDQTVLVMVAPDVPHSGEVWVKRWENDTPFGYVRFVNDQFRVQYRDDTGTDAVNGSPFDGQVPTGAYTMVSMRLDNGTALTMGIHTDGAGSGQYDDDTFSPAASFANGAPARFGGLVQFGNVFNAFDGTIAYARIYDRVLSEGELDLAYSELLQVVDQRRSGAVTSAYRQATVTFEAVEARSSGGAGASSVDLQWTLVRGGTGATFVVERRHARADGPMGEWGPVGRRAPQGRRGTLSPNGFAFVDDALPDADRLEYRVRAVGARGEVGLSPTVSVDRTPDRFEVLGAYPNPMQGTGTLAVNLPAAGRLDVRVYDMLGRQLLHPLAGDPVPAGRHRIALDVGRLGGGLYLARVTYDGRPAPVVRLVVLR
jgi:hypothetical protein